MSTVLEKVTALITRKTAAGHELLLFEHPYAGIQIPAGTVREGERHEDAVRREAMEESGLAGLRVQSYLGEQETPLPDPQRVVLRKTTVYARPDRISFDWAFLPQGPRVTLLSEHGEFAQVLYEELDLIPDPQRVTMSIMGWVLIDDLARSERRHFYHLVCAADTEREWVVYVDNHRFRLFWADVNELPDILSPQDSWLTYLPEDLFQQGQAAHEHAVDGGVAPTGSRHQRYADTEHR